MPMSDYLAGAAGGAGASGVTGAVGAAGVAGVAGVSFGASVFSAGFPPHAANQPTTNSAPIKYPAKHILFHNNSPYFCCSVKDSTECSLRKNAPPLPGHVIGGIKIGRSGAFDGVAAGVRRRMTLRSSGRSRTWATSRFRWTGRFGGTRRPRVCSTTSLRSRCFRAPCAVRGWSEQAGPTCTSIPPPDAPTQPIGD